MFLQGVLVMAVCTKAGHIVSLPVESDFAQIFMHPTDQLDTVFCKKKKNV